MGAAQLHQHFVQLMTLSIKIYPNPNDGNFKVVFSNSNSQELYIEIFNLLGEEIYIEKFNSKDQINIHLPEGNSGMLNVLIKSENESIYMLMNVLN